MAFAVAVAKELITCRKKRAVAVDILKKRWESTTGVLKHLEEGLKELADFSIWRNCGEELRIISWRATHLSPELAVLSFKVYFELKNEHS